MKKKIIFAFVICLSLIITVSAVNISDYKIIFGYEDITSQSQSFIQDDKIFVSVRNLCDELNIPIYWDENKKEVHIDIYNKKTPLSDKTEYKEEGVIPDEETALIIGKTILEKYAGRSLEYETEDKIYYIDATYIKRFNAWMISQTYKYKFVGGWSAGDRFYWPHVILSKNTGEVLYLNTHSDFPE